MQGSTSPSSGGYQPGLTVTSLTSRGGGSICSSMCSSPRSRYGPEECVPRRFSSRHVPKAAEELAQRSDLLSDSAVGQFNGLMKYLKPNTEWEEQQKQALASDIEALVPEDWDEALRGEFERRCAFGERLNTELMSSAKWIKLLKDISVVAPAGDGYPQKRRGSIGGSKAKQLTHAQVDIIYHKVMHNCDHGGKRLTFDLFCKALYIAAQACRPDLGGEAALADIIARIAAAAPQEAQEVDWSELLIDPNVVMVLDQFKPALHDLHTTFCRHGLAGMEKACHGRGAIRLRERSFWSYSQGTQGSQGLTGFTAVSRTSRRSICSNPGHSPGSPTTPVQDHFAGPAANVRSSSRESHKGPAELSSLGQVVPGGGPLGTLPTLLEGGSKESSPKHGNRIGSPSVTNITNELWGETVASVPHPIAPSDLYTYVNGAPVPRNRHKMMSLDQWLALNRQFDVMPELMSRLEVVKIFKRAQLSGQASNHGGSTYGYLNQEGFAEAVGILALQAYAKEPYCDEFPEAHDRIHAFLLRILPVSSKVLHERFGAQRMALAGNCPEVPTVIRPA